MTTRREFVRIAAGAGLENGALAAVTRARSAAPRTGHGSPLERSEPSLLHRDHSLQPIGPAW